MSEAKLEHVFIDPNIQRKGGLLNRHLKSKYESEGALPFFSLIEFNLSGLCNRTCVFCPRSDPKVYPNRNEHIPVELYEKVMRELAQVDYDGVFLYSAFSEPLLYKKIEVIIEMSKEYLPKVRLEAVTDGDFVEPAKLRSLFGAGLDALFISMYDGPEQEEKFSEMRGEVGLTDNQVILRRRWLPPEEHYGITLNNRSGMIEVPEAGLFRIKEPLKRRCFYPFYQVLVDYDGAVLLCPHDWAKKLVVGNVRDKTVHEIWNSAVIRRVRTSLAKADRNFAPCNQCDVDGTLMGSSHFNRWLSSDEGQTSGQQESTQ